MSIFDFLLGKPKVEFTFNKAIYCYGDFIEGNIAITPRKTLELKDLKIELTFFNDGNDRILGFFNDYNREYPSLIINVNRILQAGYTDNISFKIESSKYFNKEDIKEYFDTCKNNPDYTFGEDRDIIINSFKNPKWKIGCEQLGFILDLQFDNSSYIDFVNNYNY